MSTESTSAPTTAYEWLGGESALFELVARFYWLMDEDPRYAGIRAMHPADLSSSRDKLFMFLSGWLGGPSLYIERYGHPRLRARHLPFPIGSSERDQWLNCMAQALEDTQIDPELGGRLRAAFFQTADFMRNTDEQDAAADAQS